MKNVLKITAGALVPSLAIIIFNILNFLFDNFRKVPLPPLSDSVFDISVGCAFAVVGIAVTAKQKDVIVRLMIGFCLVLLAILGIGLILPFFDLINKLSAIWLVNALAFFVLSWAIVEVG